jgi:hypothetical protein
VNTNRITKKPIPQGLTSLYSGKNTALYSESPRSISGQIPSIFHSIRFLRDTWIVVKTVSITEVILSEVLRWEYYNE